MLRSHLRATAIGCALLLVSAAASVAAEKIVVGVTYDAAKQAAYYSVQQKKALEMLEEEVNKAGGVLGRELDFVFLDDENNPTIAAQRVEQLNNAKAVFIMQVGSSSTGLAAQQKSQELGIPNGSPANQNARLTRPNLPSYYFRTGLLDETMAAAAANYIKSAVSSPKVAVVKDPTPQGLMLGDAAEANLRSAGVNVVTVEQVPTGAASATPQALRVMQSGANAVLLVAAGLPEMVAYTKAHKQLGNQAAVVGFSATGVAEFLKLAGANAEGVVITDIIDYNRADVTDVTNRLAARDPVLLRSPVALSAYSFGKMLIAAMERAGSPDRAKIRDEMERTKNFPTLLGYEGTTITMTPENHDGITDPKQIVYRVVKGGAFETLPKK